MTRRDARTALDRHAQQVMRHVTQLSEREYWTQFQPAPEMVVLFLAGDHFLSAALERDPELLERALARKVLLATPVTLVSVLKGVAYGWRQERLAQNAEELRRIASEFYERMRAFRRIVRRLRAVIWRRRWTRTTGPPDRGKRA